MIETFDKGWDDIELLLKDITETCSFAVVESKQRRLGMFHVTFVSGATPAEQFILDSISYMLERKSVWICEKCGGKGFIRKNMTPRRILCLSCFAITLSEISETQPTDGKMFYTKEDLDELAPVVEAVLGKQAVFANTTPDLMNMVVTSTKYGKIWYGDVTSMEVLTDRCKQLKRTPAFEHDTLTVSQMDHDRELLTF